MYFLFPSFIDFVNMPRKREDFYVRKKPNFIFSPIWFRGRAFDHHMSNSKAEDVDSLEALTEFFDGIRLQYPCESSESDEEFYLRV